ncbi:unnamed protein product [Gongylonema pulchrum]|uniref:DCB domain-containing protein n=1 Tax=Gongylonema pulchrum TaxID=637853 RepID=A0A183EIR0_9BILA|nr:unnamed protein product [Gongylonema pulchrum]
MSKTTTSENETLVMSTLKAIALLPVIKSPVQCRLLTIIVEVMCKDERQITIKAVMESLTLCTQTYENAEETSVRLACRAAVTQIFSSFCGSQSQQQIAIFMDATALLNEVIKRANAANSRSDEVVILLDAIYSILSSQPIIVTEHQPFLSVIWRELSPCLMKLLGEPEKNTRDSGDGNEPVGRGQRSAATRSKVVFDHPELSLALYQ